MNVGIQKEDWATIKAKMDDIYGKITARKTYGPDDEQMQRR
ncbi:hypothetical protein [Parageobacillus sp. VR-IP]|nr:hypothetical protein [Parageobacillus sp. VR-IP]